MKKFLKVLSGSFLAIAVVTTAIVSPIEITKNNKNSNIASTSPNIINKQIKTTKNTNIDSVLSQVPKLKLENIINNLYSNNPSKTNISFIESSSVYNNHKIIVEKAKQIINELYTNKITYNTLIQQTKNKFNDLTAQQKAYINNKIVEQKINSSHTNTQTSLFSYPIIQLNATENNQQNINSLINNTNNILGQLNKLKGCAIAMSVATAAQWIVAPAEACIWFIGWIEVGFTIAAAIADTAATALLWLTYNQAFNPINNALGGIMTLPSWKFLTFDDRKNLINDIKDIANKTLKYNLDRLRTSMFAAEGANSADEWADSADSATITLINCTFLAIDVIDTLLDATMIVAGSVSVTW